MTAGPSRYDEVIEGLRAAYDAAADERDGKDDAPWKLAERQTFLALMRTEGRTRLLEVGAGTGVHGRWFADQGLDVVATDLSPELVERCRAKGLTAHVMDFLHLDFPAESFDAVFAMNTLLHVPKSDFAAVLESIGRQIPAGGLFYLGQYGGVDSEGPAEGDHYVPKRFFSRFTDAGLRAAVEPRFEVVDFHQLPIDSPREGWRFQSLTLRKPSPGAP